MISAEEQKNYLMALLRQAPLMARLDTESAAIFFYRMNFALNRIRSEDVDKVNAIEEKALRFNSVTLATMLAAGGLSHLLLSRRWRPLYSKKMVIAGHYLFHFLAANAVALQARRNYEGQKAAVVDQYHFTAQDVREATDFLIGEVKRGNLYLADNQIHYRKDDEIISLE